MMIVLARGMSMPFSIIVVATSTSPLKATKSSITCSISFSFICPCATVTRACGTSLLTTAAPEFEFDGRLDDGFRELYDLRLDGEAVARRRLYDRHVAQPHQTHVEGARDGRRGEREHVHALLQLFEPLLVRDAEA